jgi:hypothetical protein
MCRIGSCNYDRVDLIRRDQRIRIRKDGSTRGNCLRPSRVGIKNPRDMSTGSLVSEYPGVLGAHDACPDDSYADAHFTSIPNLAPKR